MIIGNFSVQFNTSALTSSKLRHKPISEVPYWKMYRVCVTPTGKERTSIGTATFQEWKAHFEMMAANGEPKPSKTYFEAYPRLSDRTVMRTHRKVITEKDLQRAKRTLDKMLAVLQSKMAE